MSRGARDPRQPVTVKWDPTTLLLSFIGSDDDLPIAGFASDSDPSISKSLVDAKGDLIAATADNTPARLAVGSDGDSLVADSTQTSGLAYSQTAQPNLVLNSDFGRRTVFGLAMPEVFADTSGFVQVAGTGGVASNIYTATAANHEIAWCNQSFVWRDGRASATFKAVATAGTYQLKWRISATDYISCYMNAGTFYLAKTIASVGTNVTSVAQALTLNRWYWLEVERQGTSVTVKIYDTGGTVSGVTKASSTLLQTLTGTISDSSVAVGAHISVLGDTNATQWGGIATGNGGVYVETWLPESCVVAFTGVLGGQAIGFDESADAGPLGKQWAVRTYTPATSRLMTVLQSSATGIITPSVAYTMSMYEKVSGKGGSGVLVYAYFYSRDNAGAYSADLAFLSDASETSWTRKTATATMGAAVRGFAITVNINPASTATGTAFFMLPQLERGGVATAWRSAPADDAPIVWGFTSAKDIALAAAAEIDPRDLGANLFLPWDANVMVYGHGVYDNSGANANYVKVSLDGSLTTAVVDLGGTTVRIFSFAASWGLISGLKAAAGKHRFALTGDRAAGTETFRGSGYASTSMTIVATRGK